MNKIIIIFSATMLLTSLSYPGYISEYCSNCEQTKPKCQAPLTVTWQHCGAEEWIGPPFTGCREFRFANWTCPNNQTTRGVREDDEDTDSCNGGTCSVYL